MDILLQRALIHVCWIIVLFNTACCLTCGQTPCSDEEYCCSQKQGEPKNCCCRSDTTGFSITCVSGTSTVSGFPWWGVLLIVVAVVGIITAVVFVIYRRKKRQTYGQI
ncbi:uncharacterized protein LOC123562854 [Mercenaria mercenaria]|uniref:uncharacterized protein LOC123562854 n=1 Tax=Mercenaria mercenaria TaxID=6596 RepID=UPI00234EA068|nr:uncharacterized protein LOC123562854 [Mercenaria mercenaria]